MAQKLDELNNTISVSTKGATNAINNLSKSINSLADATSKIETGGLENLTKSLMSFNSIVSQMHGTGKTINEIASGIGKFSKMDTNGLINAGKGITSLSMGLNNIGIVTANQSTINQLATIISSIKTLGLKSGNTGIANLPTLGASLKAFINDINSAGSLNADFSGVASISEIMRQLGGANAQKAIGNLPSLTTGLKNMVTTLNSLPNVSDNVVRLVEAYAQLASSGQKVGSAAKGINNALKTSSDAKTKATSKSNLLKQAWDKLGNSATKAKTKTFNLTSAIGKFYATYFIVIRGMKSLWSSIEKSMDYLETVNYFSAAMGQITSDTVGQWESLGYDSADAYVESFSKRATDLTEKMSGYTVGLDGSRQMSEMTSLGISPTELLQYQTVFAQMGSSIGLASDNAIKLSNVLTELGADLASVRNMDFNEVWENLASGNIAGMSRTMDKYGINVRAAAVDQRLLAMGINTTYEKLSAQDKVLMRTLITIEDSKYAWADLSDTLNSPANALRRLQNRFETLAVTIGNTFLGAVVTVMPYINALTVALEKMFVWIQGFLNVDVTGLVSSLGSSSSSALDGLLDSLDDAEDGVDGVTGAVEELKKSLTSIDEAVVLSDNSSSGSGTDLSGDSAQASQQIQDAFDAIYEEYQKAWDEAYARVDKTSSDLADKIYGYFQPIQKLFEDIFNGNWVSVGNDLSNILHDVTTSLTDLINSTSWENIGNIINGFVEGFDISQSATDISDLVIGIEDALHEAITSVDFKALGTWFSDGFTSIDWYNTIYGISTLRHDIFNALTDTIKGIDWSGVGQAFSDGFVAIDWGQLAIDVSELSIAIINAISDFLEEADWDSIGESIGEALDNIEWGDLLYSVGKLIVNAVIAASKAVLGSFKTCPFETSLLAAFALLKLTGVGSVIWSAISTQLMSTATMSGIGTALTTSTTISSMSSVGTSWGLAIAASISAAIIGYNLGNKIYEWATGEEIDPNYGLSDIPGSISDGSWKGAIDEYKKEKQEKEKSRLDKHNDTLRTREANEYASNQKQQHSSDPDYWRKTWTFWQSQAKELRETFSIGASKEIQESTKELEKMNGFLQQSLEKNGTSGSVINDLFHYKISSNILSPVSVALNNKIPTSSSTIGGFMNNIFKGNSSMASWWNGITTYFSTSKWSSLFSNVKTGVSNGWGSVTSWWNTNGVTKLFSNVSDSFSSSKWSGLFTTAKSGLETGWNNVLSWWSTNGSSKWKSTQVDPYFSQSAWSYGGINGGLSVSIKDALTKTGTTLKNFFDNLKIVSGSMTSAIAKIIIPKFATGGFPEDGMFMANHGELVGRFSNGKTAVANNQQIVSGIAQGTYEANQPMIELLARQNQILTQLLNKDNGISKDSLFKSVQRSARDYSRTTGNPAFPI